MDERCEYIDRSDELRFSSEYIECGDDGRVISACGGTEARDTEDIFMGSVLGEQYVAIASVRLNISCDAVES